MALLADVHPIPPERPAEIPSAPQMIIASPVETALPRPAIVSTETPEPTETIDPPVNNIPLVFIHYLCSATTGQYCPENAADLTTALIGTIYNEGGGLSTEVAADLIQILQNRMELAWNCGSLPPFVDTGDGTIHHLILQCPAQWMAINPTKIPWADISKDDFLGLAIYLMAEPYISGGITFPAWNGWSTPLDQDTISHDYQMRFVWDNLADAVTVWLNRGSIAVYQPGYFRDGGYWVEPHLVSPDQALARCPNIIYDFATYGSRRDDLYAQSNFVVQFTRENKADYIYFSTLPLR